MGSSMAGSLAGQAVGSYMFGGGSSQQAAPPAQAAPQGQMMPQAPMCSLESQQFLQCMNSTGDNMDQCRQVHAGSGSRPCPCCARRSEALMLLVSLPPSKPMRSLLSRAFSHSCPLCPFERLPPSCLASFTTCTSSAAPRCPSRGTISSRLTVGWSTSE